MKKIQAGHDPNKQSNRTRKLAFLLPICTVGVPLRLAKMPQAAIERRRKRLLINSDQGFGELVDIFVKPGISAVLDRVYAGPREGGRIINVAVDFDRSKQGGICEPL